jgi:hypothetical protein
VWHQPSEQVAASSSVIDMKHCMDTHIRLRSRSQDQRLDVVERERYLLAMQECGNAFWDSH